MSLKEQGSTIHWHSDLLQKNIIRSNALWFVIFVIESSCLSSHPLIHPLTICKSKHNFTESSSSNCIYKREHKIESNIKVIP